MSSFDRRDVCAYRRGLNGIIFTRFGEYALADPQWTVPLPSDMSFPELAPLMCAGSTAYGAILNAIEGAPTEEKPDGGRFPGVSKGGWIAMVGIGGLGILGVQMAKAMGYKVVASENREYRIFDSGAGHSFNASCFRS